MHLTLAPAQNGLNPQEQLAHAERLHHVVVRAELETDHAIDLFALRRQHHHRDCPRPRTFLELLADLRSGNIGKHQIEQNEIGSLPARQAQPFCSELRDDGIVAGLFQVVGKDLLQILLIFDH